MPERYGNKPSSILQEEGYISAPDADSRVKFLSFLLRDYWSRNHG